MIGVWQLVLILVIVLVLFGAGRVPKIMHDLGAGMKAFKEGINQENEGDNDNNDVTNGNKKVVVKRTKSKGNKKK